MAVGIPQYVAAQRAREIEVFDGDTVWVAPSTTEKIVELREALYERLNLREDNRKPTSVYPALWAQMGLAKRVPTLTNELDVKQSRHMAANYIGALLFRTDAAIANSSTLTTSLAKRYGFNGELPKPLLSETRLEIGDLLLRAEQRSVSPSTPDVMMKLDALVLSSVVVIGDSLER